MERQGFDLPLMIGGATTSRVHTAVKIHPNYQRGQAVYVNDASRAVGVAQALMSVERASRLRRRDCAANTPRSPPRMRARRTTRSGCRLPTARANALKLDWSAPTQPPKPSFIGTKVLERLSDRGTGRLHRLDAVLLRPGSSPANFPPFSTTRNSARPRARCYDDARAMLRQDRGRELVHGQRRVRLLAGQCARATISCCMATRRATRRSRRCMRCASSCPSAKAAPMSRWRISSRRAPAGVPDYVGGFAVTAGIGEDDDRRALQARQ